MTSLVNSNLVNGKVEINKLVNEIHDNNLKSGWCYLI